MAISFSSDDMPYESVLLAIVEIHEEDRATITSMTDPMGDSVVHQFDRSPA